MKKLLISLTALLMLTGSAFAGYTQNVIVNGTSYTVTNFGNSTSIQNTNPTQRYSGSTTPNYGARHYVFGDNDKPWESNKTFDGKAQGLFNFDPCKGIPGHFRRKQPRCIAKNN